MKNIFLSLICLLLFKCNYLKDRCNDAGDIYSFSIDESVGAEVSLGKLTFGLFLGNSIVGCKYSECYYETVDDSSETFKFFTYQRIGYRQDSYKDSEGFPYLVFRNKLYSIDDHQRGKIPLTYYGRIKVRAGFSLGVSFEFNFLELADFALGFAGIDFLEDDYNQYIEELIQNRKRERETGLKNSKLEKRK